MSVIGSVINSMTEHGNVIISKVVTFMGVSAGIVGGGALGVSNNTVSKIANSQEFGLPDWAAVVAIVSGICLVIKNSVEVYYTIKNEKRRDTTSKKRKAD